MGFVYEERASASPYVEKVTHGWTVGSGTTIRPAEYNWHMVFVKVYGQMLPLYVGPLTTSGVVAFEEGAEILWIKFKLGTFMPHLPVKNVLDSEVSLPDASRNAFWLNSDSWQFPDFENADSFIEQLVRQEVLVYDPVVSAVLQDEEPGLDIASRTIRYRFLRATGLTQTYIRQMKRAQQAEALLRRGMPILDATFEAGYFDQPHLTRSLKQFIGYTPAQIVEMSKACHFIQDTDPESDYHTSVPAEVR